MARLIELSSGALSCGVAPELGGSLLWFRDGRRDILRPAPAGVSDPLDCACFPMAPWVNRIGGGEFHFDSATISLKTLPRFHPHAIHGQAWRKRWRVLDHGPAHATLECVGGGDDWPWRYRVLQSIGLEADANELNMELMIENLASRPMPAALGLHPCFAVGPQATLQFNAEGMIATGPDDLPVRVDALHEATNFSAPRVITGCGIDNAFTGWDGHAVLNGCEILSDAPFAQLYAPAGQAYVCFEPQTAPPNAPNWAEGSWDVLAPGDSLSMFMDVRAPQRAGKKP
jgi:aldose 1-epimerase